MRQHAAPALAKWPFIVGDLLLLAVAWWIVNRSSDPFSFWPLLFLVGCVAGGAWITVYPYLAEYRGALKLAESEGLHDAVAKINQLQHVADRIGHATGQWQDIQNQAIQTTSAARGITEQMAGEAKAFGEFLQKANDSEKAHLRLEVDKLRRSENEWVQTLVMLMDHVYGIFAAAVRSGKQQLIDQLAQYQRACREVVRRVGLVPIEAKRGEPYRENSHQLADPEAAMPEDPVVELTLATGYTYQGQIIRKPLVSILNPADGAEMSGDLFQLESEAASPDPAPAPAPSGTPDDAPDSGEDAAPRQAGNPF